MQRLWRVLIAIFLLMLVATSGLSMPGAQAATWPIERVGSSGPNVVVLQYLLQAHGYAVGVDGIFGPQTQHAVELFQKAQGLTPNGVVGSATWPRAIVPVQRGSTGSAVKALQYVLITTYGYRLTVNGSFGSASYSSVADFQRKHGLAVDGIAGPITWNALIAGTTAPVPTPVKTVPHTPTPVPVTVVAALTAVPSTVNRGGVLTVSGAGFAPNELVFIYFNALPKTVTPVRATAAGLLPATGVTAPYSLPPGSHTLTALGITSKRTAHTTVVVQALAPDISLSATTASPGNVITVSGHGFGTHEQVTLSLNSAALTTNPTVVTTVNGAFTAAFAVPSRLLDGPNTVSAIGNVSRVSAIATLNGTLPIASQFYFAGAVNTATEHSSVHILNTNGESASVRLTFFFGSGATDTKLIVVAAHAEKVVAVASLEPFTGPFGLDLQANRRISAQISVARDGQDGDTLLGNTGLGQTWYMAEGYTGLTFHESVSILNADFNAPAHVQLQLLPFGGRPSRTIAVTVPPHADYIADINSQMPNQSLSIIARSDIPVAVERTLTFSNNGFGMTTRAGTNTPATSWLFAEGTTTTRFQTFLTILNPNTTPALVTASFFGQTGGSLGSKTIEVAGLSRANLKLNDVLQASGVASVVTSNLPVVVERPEYFGSPNSAYVAGSDVFGRNGANASWTFPGGETANTSEFLLVYNPSPSPVTIAATLYGSDGNTVTKYVSVAPTVRATLNVNVLFAGLAPEHGIRLRTTNGLGFVAEQTIFAPDYSTLESTEGSSS